MQPFIRHQGIVAPMDRANVDTDAILPKQFMKLVSRSGFGQHLFDGLRYLDVGEPGVKSSERKINPDFVLNQPRFHGASILLARRNFGCGSSREHAPWAIADYGFRVLIAPSFADIFASNCLKNGLLLIALDDSMIDALFEQVANQKGFELQVDLAAQTMTTPSNQDLPFHVSAEARHTLLNGLDDITRTLAEASAIAAFEQRHREANPWLFNDRAMHAFVPAQK